MRLAEKRVQDVYARLAARIRLERERKGLSMLAVAERAGLSQQMVSACERGLRRPSLDTLIRVSDVLGIALGPVIGEAMSKK